jgi:Domain of unknown function (DUF4160)
MPGIRVGRLRWVIYPNDHPPPHVHVIGPGWEIRIELLDPPSLLSIAGSPKAGNMVDALVGIANHLDELRQLWSRLHD